MNLEMQKALEQDGENLRGLTGQDHGPIADFDLDAWIASLDAPTINGFKCRFCGRDYNKERVLSKHLARYHS